MVRTKVCKLQRRAYLWPVDEQFELPRLCFPDCQVRQLSTGVTNSCYLCLRIVSHYTRQEKYLFTYLLTYVHLVSGKILNYE